MDKTKKPAVRFDISEPECRIYQIKGKASNIYAIFFSKENRTVLIDCGMPADAEMIVTFLKKRNIPLPESLIATHFHVDHISGWIKLRKKVPDCKFYVHAEARPYVKGEKIYPQPKPSDITDIMIPAMFDSMYVPTPAEIKRVLRMGTTLKIKFPMENLIFYTTHDNILPGFKIIHTPGHLYDSVSIYHKEANLLITGDFIIVISGKPLVNTYVISAKKQASSFEKIKKLIPEPVTILPGHGKAMLLKLSDLSYTSKKS